MLTIFLNFFCQYHSINSSTFPEQLKWVDVKPLFNKNIRTDKENYWPVSFLRNIFKIYERCLFKQLHDYLDIIFSQNQCGLRKAFSVVNCPFPILEKWRECLDQGDGALLTKLYCLPHKRRKRITINDAYSLCSENFFGLPKRSILGPLLFNIFICNLFMFLPKGSC